MIAVYELETSDWCFSRQTLTDGAADLFDESCECVARNELHAANESLQTVLAEMPTHIDALHHLSIVKSRMGKRTEARALSKKAVSIGLRALPKKFSWLTSRLSWLHLENRPFLRSYHHYGLQLDAAGKTAEAQEVFARLVAVCPNDNLGARFLLMEVFLARADWSNACRLGTVYNSDESPGIRYSHALALFESGQRDAAAQHLASAISMRPSVAKALLTLTDDSPRPGDTGYITVGGDDEAYEYWHDNRDYWSQNTQLMGLLRDLSMQSHKRKQ